MTIDIDLVVKVGGGLLPFSGDLDEALVLVEAAAKQRRILIVPGGGPFADTVREVDAQVRLGDTTAHWMAVLAMDQYAYVLASRLATGVVAHSRADVSCALMKGELPVLAPYRWMREADPLPHSWDVTSDSIAAWISGALGATHLLLVKPPGATGALVDPYFTTALPPTVTSAVVHAGPQLRSALEVR